MSSNEFIREWYEEYGPQWCSEQTGLSYDVTKCRANQMGLRYDTNRRRYINTHLKNHLKKDGWSETAKNLGMSIGTVRRWAKKLNVEEPPDARGAKPTKLSDKQTDFIVNNYPELSAVVIGKHIGVSRDIVERFLRETGLYIGFERRIDQSVNKSFFNKWSEDLAYVLGYMYADGTIGEYEKNDVDGRQERTICLSSITSKDKQILDDIKKRMGLTVKVCSYVKEGKTYHCLTTTCQWIYKQWVKLGLRQRKTYEGLLIPLVPDEFLYAFIRGFFDGDGSMDKRGYISFGCTDKNFLEWLGNIIVCRIGGNELNISEERNRETIFYNLDICANADKLYEWIKPVKGSLRIARKWATEVY